MKKFAVYSAQAAAFAASMLAVPAVLAQNAPVGTSATASPCSVTLLTAARVGPARLIDNITLGGGDAA